jgi:hypothetical protein
MDSASISEEGKPTGRGKNVRLFTVHGNGKLIPYKESQFKDSKLEEDLEVLLERNLEHLFEGSRILIIGRQVTTNLNTRIDLLGIDSAGNTVVVELKRDATPRETIAQLLEYAAFVEELDYSQLNEIYREYSGEESTLEDYHHQYFQGEAGESVSFNKSTRLVIVAHEITGEIRQTALFLRKKGVDICCLEFKYFKTKSGEEVISTDLVIGQEGFPPPPPKSASLPKVDENQFLSSLDSNGLEVFRRVFEFAKRNGLVFRWGSKGFSLNVESDTGYVGLFFGYPPHSVFKQSIYTGFEEIAKKVNNSDEVIQFYAEQIKNLGYFTSAKSNLKWVIDRHYSEDQVNRFLDIVQNVISKIRENGLR